MDPGKPGPTGEGADGPVWSAETFIGAHFLQPSPVVTAIGCPEPTAKIGVVMPKKLNLGCLLHSFPPRHFHSLSEKL